MLVTTRNRRQQHLLHLLQLQLVMKATPSRIIRLREMEKMETDHKLPEAEDKEVDMEGVVVTTDHKLLKMKVELIMMTQEVAIKETVVEVVDKVTIGKVKTRTHGSISSITCRNLFSMIVKLHWTLRFLSAQLKTKFLKSQAKLNLTKNLQTLTRKFAH